MSRGISETPSTLPGHITYDRQESEERTRQSSGRDQTDTKCAFGDWTVYGSDRPEVCPPLLSKLTIADVGVALV